MPRLAPSTLLFAASQNVHLPALLRICRDLPSARNELRWLTEHARQLVREDGPARINQSIEKPSSPSPQRSRLKALTIIQNIQPRKRPYRFVQPVAPRKVVAPPRVPIIRVRDNTPSFRYNRPLVVRKQSGPSFHYHQSLSVRKHKGLISETLPTDHLEARHDTSREHAAHGSKSSSLSESHRELVGRRHVRLSAVESPSPSWSNQQQEVGDQVAVSAATRVDPPGIYLSEWSETGAHEKIVDESGNVNLETYRNKLLEWQYNFLQKTQKMAQRRGTLKRVTNEIRKSSPSTPESGKLVKVRDHLEQMVDSVTLEEKYLELEKAELARLVAERAGGKPLQYIIGNQPFGNLEIICRPGVLIPRPETETYTEELGRLILSMARTGAENKSLLERNQIRILDLCTGSGCIALSLHSILKPPPGTRPVDPRLPKAAIDVRILGIDISKDAIKLARDNLKHNISKGLLHPDAEKDVVFIKENVLKIAQGEKKIVIGDKTVKVEKQSKGENTSQWDVVISNPPYISALGYALKTEASVRKYEPVQALVPDLAPEDGSRDPLRTSGSGDQFYMPIIRIARDVQAKLIAMEVGDTEQATRVLSRLRQKLSFHDSTRAIEAWRDDGSVRRVFESVPVRGSKSHESRTSRIDPKQPNSDTEGDDPNAGEIDRLVVAWKSSWAEWRRRKGSEGLRLEVEYDDPATDSVSTEPEGAKPKLSGKADRRHLPMVQKMQGMRGEPKGDTAASIKKMQLLVQAHKREEKRHALLARAKNPRDQSSKSIVHAVLADTGSSPRRGGRTQQTVPRNLKSKRPLQHPEPTQRRNPEDIISKWVS